MKKNLFGLLVLFIAALFVGCSAAPEGELAGEQELALCTAQPVASGSAGCVPGTSCPSPPSITGIRASSTGRGLEVYYNGAWQLAVDFGGAGIDCVFAGSWGGPGSPAVLRVAPSGADLDGDGPDDSKFLVNGDLANQLTFRDCWWSGGATFASAGQTAVGLTRVVAAPTDAAHQGRILLYGYDTTGTYRSFAFNVRNRCSG